jgi:TolB-like protein/cytochrome c-type biogenesis protein CcmH/NrfG
MSTESKQDSHLQIGHVLFLDTVGYSKLLIDEQRELQEQLNEIVYQTKAFRAAEAENKVVRLPTGDGMALVFFTNAEAPVRCAVEIAKASQGSSNLRLRMGINSGPVSGVADSGGGSNIAGGGINIAQRVMDLGDSGHILLSKRAAEDLIQYREWQPYLHELGEIEVKHGVKVSVVSLYTDKLGNPELPAKLEFAARKERARHARKRFAVAGAFAFALVATVALSIFLRYARQQTGPLVPEKSVAVLPLENLTEEKENAFFADGIQDELLSNLAKIKDLKVISRTSVMQYKAGITRNLKEIAQQLGVSNVVEGSVRRSGNHLRVSVQLIDALNDRHIWVQSYDRTLADSLALQGELATEIAAGVGATLSPQEKARVEATPTKNTAAYDAYLRGRALSAGLTPDNSNVVSAAQAFQEAVKLDPNFVLAWAHLSWTHSGIYWIGTDPTPSRLAAAKDALDHAVALDPNLPETHLALGYYDYYGLRDFKRALAEFKLAEKSLPNDVEVLRAIGLIQRRFAHWDEAIAALHRAVELDPRNIESAANLAGSYMAARRFSDALAVADHILAVEPSNTHGIGLKAFCYWGLGNLDAVDTVLVNPGASLHLRGHHALNKHKDAEALDLFTKGLQKAEGEEKRELLFDVARTQQRLGNVAASKAAYQQVIQELTQALGNVDKQDTGELAGLHSFLGLVYAHMGDAASAVSEGRKGMELDPTSEDPFEGPEREEQMALIYARLGKADEAIPILKKWIDVPSSTGIARTLLRVDADWDPIRNDPRFQELVGPNQ